MGRVTIKDVAREAGVSLGAVSQALSPNPKSTIKVGDATIMKVQKAAAKLGFRPHAGAKSVRSNKFHNIGFFMAKKSGSLDRPPEGYLTGVSDAAQKRGYRIVLVGMESGQGNYQDVVPSLLREKNLDALVVASYHHLSALIHDELENMGLPVVYVNDKHEFNSAWVDDLDGARMMTDYLIERGSKNVVFAMRTHFEGQRIEDMHYSARMRIEGYTAAMKAAGLEPDIRTIMMRETLDFNQRIPDDWLFGNGRPLPDAIFAYDDDLANSIAKIMYRKGIRIPEDIALAGYNGAYASLCAWRPLTTMRIPSFEMGYTALELAIQIIEGSGQKEFPSIKFRPELVIGESTR
ncbi:LacI family DNA-binding transcriptional regulator [Pontiella sulfatireligans]|uniref:Ribose operon repressor n=1 Tax=Pontiella sulfatireligans TaxID=2750658 RepID=A0A6C2UGG8_9BACT|nr:LacI family DNA-binding transcriptional regulator [Pontiella sulfatireligans]VGO18511.1 Ribose operon repressor [Pontiella sulfatireligans]